jgi:type II secretion system protein J
VKRGFTLLEILVAMFILAVILATVYQSFQIHIRSIEHARKVQRENHIARMVLSMIARDLESAFWEEQAEDAGEDEEDEQDIESESPPLFMVKSFEEDGQPRDRISFLSLGPAWGPFRVSSSRVHEVEYRLARDEETDEILLVRREDPTPEGDLLSGGDEWLLAENVRAFEVLCVDEDGETTDSWDSRDKGYLPPSVVVRLWIWDPERPEAEPTLYALRVAIPMFEGGLT